MNIRPLEQHFQIAFYDGESSIRHVGAVTLAVNRVQIELDDRCFGWPYPECQLVSDGFYGEPVRIEHRAAPGVEDTGFFAALSQHAPELTERSWWDQQLSGWAAILRSAVGVLILGTSIYYFGIGLLAEVGAAVAPRWVEERMGASTLKLIAGPAVACAESPSTQLLHQVEKRMFAAARSDYRFKVTYARLDMVNAFAAPGGNIVVSDYLIRLTESPDEYAGVLAHEIQHVLHRDSMRAIARQLGGDMIIGMLSVDPSTNAIFLNQSTALLNLSFSRSAEEDADAGAVQLLEAAGVPGDGLTRFLNRLLEEKGSSGNLAKYISTHPDTMQRITRLRSLIHPGAPVTPILSPEQWKEARNICVDRGKGL